MADAPSPEPTQITPFPNGELGIVWSDGHESFYGMYTLRCACGCASCVDEMTGRRTLDTARVPLDVTIRQMQPVGRYGVSIAFSDGHDTGIYSFRDLRRLCQCEECRKK